MLLFKRRFNFEGLFPPEMKKVRKVVPCYETAKKDGGVFTHLNGTVLTYLLHYTFGCKDWVLM